LASLLILNITGCPTDDEPSKKDGSNNGDTGKPIQEITVFKQPTKKEYLFGESLDTTGMTVTILYTDGETETLDLTGSNYTVSGLPAQEAGQITVTITHRGKSATLTVTVHPTVFVTFNAANESEPVVTPNRKDTAVAQPSTPSKAGNFTGPITLSGLYRGSPVNQPYVFDAWYTDDDEKWVFTSSVSEDITLTAKYKEGDNPIDVSGQSGTNYAAKSISYIRAATNVGTYTLAIGEDLTLEPQILYPIGSSANSLDLTVMGIAQERKIKLSQNGVLFSIGSSSRPAVTLTLGKNITLVGRSAANGDGETDNNNALVNVVYDANFVMLEDSKITGNTCRGADYSNGYGAAVFANNDGIFTMKGGTITGNYSIATNAGYLYLPTGGVYVAHNTKNHRFIMEGGSISGNTHSDNEFDSDVYISNANISAALFTLSGNATVGKLTLQYHFANAGSTHRYANAAIAPGWSGSVAALNLSYNDSISGNGNINQAIDGWANKQVIQADNEYALQASDLSKVTLGNFYGKIQNVPLQAISPTHKSQKSGEDIGKLVPIE
jgi:hypothetical protein